MPRKFIKRYLPNSESIKNHKNLQLFGEWLHDPLLWHLQRRNVAKAFAIGLFFAFMPMPFQMVGAAAFAIFFRANLPISMVLVWLTNPLTMVPIFFACYKFGAWMLHTPYKNIQFELSFHWLSTSLLEIWQPFLFGCFVAGSIAALLGYLLINLIWRVNVGSNWKNRRHQRKKLKSEENL